MWRQPGIDDRVDRVYGMPQVRRNDEEVVDFTMHEIFLLIVRFELMITTPIEE